jgi:hypothetical protein
MPFSIGSKANATSTIGRPSAAARAARVCGYAARAGPGGAIVSLFEPPVRKSSPVTHAGAGAARKRAISDWISRNI